MFSLFLLVFKEKDIFFNAQLITLKNFQDTLKAKREVFIASKISLLRGQPILYQFKNLFPSSGCQALQ